MNKGKRTVHSAAVLGPGVVHVKLKGVMNEEGWEGNKRKEKKTSERTYDRESPPSA
jgi:hypothetical protein